MKHFLNLDVFSGKKMCYTYIDLTFHLGIIIVHVNNILLHI